MPSNLPGDICVGQHSVCLIRAALLNPDCTPVGGADSGFITTGIITATATPEVQEAVTLEQTNGCGDIEWTYERPARMRAVTLSGELAFFDHEMMQILFGGELVIGGPTSDFAGKVIGWASPNYTDDPPPALYLEFMTLTAGQGVGECSDAADGFPAAAGHIFGKARLTPGEWSFTSEAASVQFTGRAVANPNLGAGPWQDWNGVGAIPNKPHIQTSYSADEFAAIKDLAACGYATLPAGS